MTSLEAEFEEALLTTTEVAAKHKYYPHYFLQMVREHGAAKTAQMLLAKQEIQQGLMTLCELGLLDTSMEAFVIQERFQPLFTDAERAEARRRLEELYYFK